MKQKHHTHTHTHARKRRPLNCTIPLIVMTKKNSLVQTSDHDGGIDKHTSPPCTTTEKNYNWTTKKITQNYQKTELY